MSTLNKPRVFLSHSSKDKRFIERLASDLRKSKIEPWLDTEEIRDGKPFLKVIFEDGLPTCDIIIVYLTENSIKSRMVEKEIDAALIAQLADKKISFIPYINKSELRNKLRVDIRALQCREWNDENYYAVLPSVVSEIWQSYVERAIKVSTPKKKHEKFLPEIKSKILTTGIIASPFSTSEVKEFQYFYNLLNRKLVLRVGIGQKEDGNAWIDLPQYFDQLTFSLLNLLIVYMNEGYSDIFPTEIDTLLSKQCIAYYHQINLGTPDISAINFRWKRGVELRTLGLTKFRSGGYEEFTSKMYRFKYWLGYNDLLLDKIIFEPLKVHDSTLQTTSNWEILKESLSSKTKKTREKKS